MLVYRCPEIASDAKVEERRVKPVFPIRMDQLLNRDLLSNQGVQDIQPCQLRQLGQDRIALLELPIVRSAAGELNSPNAYSREIAIKAKAS